MHIAFRLESSQDILQSGGANVPMYPCSSLMQIFMKRVAYKKNWPLLGLQLFMLGKLYWYLEMTKQCLSCLTEANGILVVTHGEDAKVTRELQQLLQEAIAEWNHKSR